jgi:hypothetical protein
VIDGYGRGFLYTHFRRKGFIVARDRLFKIYRTINPEAVERRRHNLQQRRGEYLVPGPNFIWSIDGHNKLKPYGIEIYGCIDAYSRYVIWLYVGVSNATAVSCFRQYLDAIEAVGKQPSFIRSDRGNETVMLADAHLRLQKDQEPEVRFEDCYLYGTSTANQRIKARTNPFLSVYEQLRTVLQSHIESNASPQLSLLQSPVGAFNWPGRADAVRSVDLEADMDTDLLEPV